jgi:hypothetical protein
MTLRELAGAHQMIFTLFLVPPHGKVKTTTPQVMYQNPVSQCGLAIHIEKYLKAKEELWKLKYFTTQKL